MQQNKIGLILESYKEIAAELFNMSEQVIRGGYHYVTSQNIFLMARCNRLIEMQKPLKIISLQTRDLGQEQITHQEIHVSIGWN
jgi:hypothetical protein